MKAATAAAKQLIQRSGVVNAVPKLIAEWEHNRMTPIQSISVSPTPLADAEYQTVFPVDSVGKPNRPRTGIAKARLNDKLKASTGYRDYPQASRFYVSTQDDVYSYWSSTQKTKLVKGADNAYAFDAPVSIELVYEKAVIANKLVVGFENSYSKPATYYVEVTSNGTSWVGVGGFNPALNVDGQIVLWRNNKSQWTDTPDYVNPGSLRGIRVTVESMTDAYSHLDVLQLGLRLENDLTDFVESYDAGFEVADASFIAPMGKASSNVGSISLSNIDRRFNNENTSSLYKGLIDKKVKFKMDISLDAASYGGSPDERIRELTMWSDSWDGQEEESVSVSLKDSSAILQETNMPKVFWENLTIGAIVWQTMDILGLSNYAYTRSELDSGQIVPYYWPGEGTTVWEEFSTLAESTQTAIYFDEYDVMQIKTRKSLFAPNKGIDWNLDAVQNGQKLPDIESLSSREDNYVNSVDVEYKPTQFKSADNGLPKMEVAWEPAESTLTLRSSDLTRDLAANGTEIWIKYSEVAFWPYESLINVRGEIMRYKGKEYIWRKPGGGLGAEIVYSLEQQKAVDAKSDPNLAWANSWSGKLLLTERGIGGSGVAKHSVRGASYSGAVTNFFDTQYTAYDAGIKYNDGTMSLVPPTWADPNSYYLVKHEATLPADDTVYGTRFRFPEQQILGNNWATAGLWIAGNLADAGYFIEIASTESVENVITRTVRNEISLVKMPASGQGIRVPNALTTDEKGFAAQIIRGNWYDVDVRISKMSDGNTSIMLWLNGVTAATWFIDKNTTPPNNGKFGVFTKHQCNVEFEYLYAVNSKTAAAYQGQGVDESTYLDLVTGGFTSGYIEREWRFGTYTTLNISPARLGGAWNYAIESRANYVYDEFGPIVHEVREFDVSFEESKSPVAHSFLEFSNSSGIVCTDYYADSFGAKFTLINASRKNEIVKGDDTLTIGNGETISHNIYVYGRSLYQDESVTINRKDEHSINKRGLSQLTFNNRFIQTEDMATELADWVVQAWKNGSEEVSVSIFGNPFIQVGDYVTINYPVKDMTPSTHRYIVIRKNNKWENGLSTELVLRRLKI